MKNFLVLLIVLLSITVFGQNFPFPQDSYSYDYGYRAVNNDYQQIQAKFQNWKNLYYVENGAMNMARVQSEIPMNSQSIDIANGMLIFVYMDNETNQTQDEFDKLLKYYQVNSYDGSGFLMNKELTDFNTNPVFTGSNTIADLDVALALLMAHKQWGSNGTNNYIQLAESLLDAIYNNEIRDNLIVRGNYENNMMHSSYQTLATIKLFSIVQERESFGKQNDWNAIYNKAVSYLTNTQSNGLWVDQTVWSVDPLPICSDNCAFFLDAPSTLQRLALDYLWFGSQESFDLLLPTREFMGAMNLDLNPHLASGFNNVDGASYASLTPITSLNLNGKSYYVGAFGSVLSVGINGGDESSLNNYYGFLTSIEESTSKANCNTNQLLYMLLLSGNFQNFYSPMYNPDLVLAQLINTVLAFTSTVNSTGINQGDWDQTAISDLEQKRTEAQDMLLNGSYTNAEFEAKIVDLNNALQVAKSSQHFYNFLIDDCETPELNHYLGGFWYTILDYIGSTVSPNYNNTPAHTLVPNDINSSQAISYTVTTVEPIGSDYQFSGSGLYFNEDQSPLPQDPNGGISLYIKTH